MTRLEAHRGVSARYPENTLAAFSAAAREGYGMIELDPKYTADGRFVILHDRTTARTARDADGQPVSLTASEVTLDALRALDVGSFFSPAFAGERIPTLEEVLALALDTGVPLKFDNCLYGFPAPLRQAFYEIVAASEARPLVGFTCASVEHIREILAVLPDAAIHYDGPVLGADNAAVDPAILAQLSALVPPERLTVWLPLRKMSWLPYPPATRETVAAVQTVGGCGLWILSDAEGLAHALSLGGDWIETTGAVTPAMLP